MAKRSKSDKTSPVASISDQSNDRSPLSSLHTTRITRRSIIKKKRILDFSNVPDDFNEFMEIITETIVEKDPKKFFMKCFHMYLTSKKTKAEDQNEPTKGSITKDETDKVNKPEIESENHPNSQFEERQNETQNRKRKRTETSSLNSSIESINENDSSSDNQTDDGTINLIKEMKSETMEVSQDSDDVDNDLLEMEVTGPDGPLKIYFYYLINGKKVDETEYESFWFKLNVEKIKLGSYYYECGCSECLGSKNPRTGDFKYITRHQLSYYNAKFLCSMCDYQTQEKCNFIKHLEKHHSLNIIHKRGSFN